MATEHPSPSPSIEQLEAAIGRLAGEIHAANYRFLALIRQFDERLGWAKWGLTSCAEWLAWRCDLSLSAAREKVRSASALRELPEISKAFEQGSLSYTKVRALTRVANPETEAALLTYALQTSATNVEERCRQVRCVEPASADRARRNWAQRSLSAWRNTEKGSMTISVELPLEVGELVTQALDCAIAAGDVADGPEFADAAWRTQQADALVAVAKSYLAGGSAERATSADQYQVVVHVDETALTDGEGRSDLPIDTVKRLTCDAPTIRVIENEKGEPLNIGRKRRRIPTAIKRALWSRDRGCSFPGCHCSKFVDAHHIEHWCEGGQTSLENLALLCSHHHRLVHEGGYRIKRDPEDELYFQRPDGRVDSPTRLPGRRCAARSHRAG